MTLPLGMFANRPAPFEIPERTPHEGVPDHLEAILRQWIYNALLGGGAQLVSLRLEIALSLDDLRDEGDGARAIASAPRGQLLAIADVILGAGGPWPATARRSGTDRIWQIEQLRQALTEGSSAWRVNSGGTGLTRRVDESVARAAEQAASRAEANPQVGSAAKQLRAAWHAIYKLEPDPEQAYREAVKAVESAAQAVVQPNHSGATLGSMRAELRSNPARWRLAIPGKDGTGDITPLIAMISLLWDGQEWRHGGQVPTRDATPEEAEMALYLATTLVHCFATGAIRRRR